MRIRLPVSRGSFTVRYSAFDVGWAFVCPWLALWIRGTPLGFSGDWLGASYYCGIAFVSSLIAFLIFRIRDGMSHLFSVHDTLEVAKAVVLSEFMTFLLLFTVTRLEGIPRSTPLIHALILSAGLVGARAFVGMMHSNRDMATPTGQAMGEHIIIVGANKLAELYINFLRAYAPEQHRVIAALDDRTEMIGRSVAGVRVLGPSNHLLPIIEEFKEHGINTDRIIISGDSVFLTPEAMAEVRGICAEYNMRFDFLPQLLGLDMLQEPVVKKQPAMSDSVPVDVAVPHYLHVKRYIDFILSSLLIIILLPVMLVIATIVLVDVGSPIFFWQQRIGMNGQAFQMHKFRTLKPTFDWRGIPVSAAGRMSFLGAFLRKLRLDELPQLLNVLVGDMSLIGPRPLLPRDQPSDRSLRLMVRPGITGWAQVNGGQLLSPEEKNTLDEWYVRNASFWLDLRIVGRTILFLLNDTHREAPPNKTRLEVELSNNRQSNRGVMRGS
jgi:lipopolysaccharide/colanic/teichoic acid biosynthesis glycosyltransferase